MERRYSEIACTDTITVKTPKEDAAEDPMNEFGVTGEQMEQIFKYISDHEESNQKIFFDGQIYDAFSLLIGLIQKAETEIVLVDGYVDVDNFNAQYPKLDVKYTRAFHDCFLILDKTKAYYVGASLKDAGKKCFGINLIEDAGIVRDILQRVELETEE